MKQLLDHMTQQEALEVLQKFDAEVADKRERFIGYPMNSHINLDPFFEWWTTAAASHSPLNDVGDPDHDLPYLINARWFERKVIEAFAHLLHMPEGSYWGFITSGGILGNEQGLWIGRERLKKYGKPIFYFSEEAHYSIPSLARLIDLESRVIRSLPHGEMDYQHFEEILDPSRPVLMGLTVGTTFKGAIDRVEKVHAILKKRGVLHSHIHVDAALFGGYLPFLDDPMAPCLDLSQHLIDTIAISGHKFFGSPIPMGIFLTQRAHINELDDNYIEYIYTKNLTIPCSRSTLNTLLFWWILETKPSSAWQQDAKQILANANYLYEQLIKKGIPAWLNPYSNTVYFRAPSEEIRRRWRLAQMQCKERGDLAHIVVMQHVTKSVIDSFLQSDLKPADSSKLVIN